MAALTSLALAASVGTMAYGAYESYQGGKQSGAGAAQAAAGAQMQAEAARLQAGIAKEQAASSVVYAGKERDINVRASNQSITAAGQSRDINQGIIAQEFAIQDQQRKAMELDARRASMEVIRNQQRARAMSLATGVAQGGSGYVGGSSARGGAYGQIAGQSGVNLMGIQQNLQIGQDIFAANTNISNSKIAASNLEYQYALQQAQNQTDKSNIAYSYAQVNADYQTRYADTQTMMAQGAAQIAIGQAQMQKGSAQASFGQSLISGGANIFSTAMNVDKLFPQTSGMYGSLLGSTGVTGGAMAPYSYFNR